MMELQDALIAGVVLSYVALVVTLIASWGMPWE